jgi:hypothetical protein
MLRAGLRALGGLALLHTAATGASVLHATTGRFECWNHNMVPPPLPSWQPSEQDARLERLVSQMYSGAGFDSDSCSEEVIFEDAAALCRGRAEVREVFRALSVMRPEHISRPEVCYSSGSSAVLLLHQRYLGFLTLRSELHVALDAAGRISGMQERWNGKQPLGSSSSIQSLMFYFDPMSCVRRANAILSHYVTTMLIT